MCEIAVAYLATPYAADRTSLACGEGGEIIVKKETLLALVEHIVHNLFVESGAECGGHESLSLAASEDSGSVRPRKRFTIATRCSGV